MYVVGTHQKHLSEALLLEAPRRGASNEYPQHMFLWRNKKKYPRIITKYSSLTSPLRLWFGMVGCGKGVLYLTSLGHPTDILAYSWAMLAVLVAGKGRGECFYFFCFFPFIPVPLSSLYLSFISSTISCISFLPFSGRQHKMTHKG